ncbi:LysR family transcriptional regulator [Alicycliphilus denitrificans]|uniref:LysR family transcriptional regulator n=1 Tax=Alicycliphilus denitrificans TaxID=179636 RepID=A0A858ZN90_9BURK|nr:LysR substrate-binding domain-containing protein [Alicycliphilus denitrificans]QKD42273.1 LysR family transcriptional regulator [Alicycliphilus denitrificans]GAO25874.1 transcriptional regulator, LysR family [Alicycliphilus sp. B1]
MELRHLRYFVAVYECRSFRRAAERVHVTQSTLSHQMAQLESELGERLFDRVGKGLRVTEAGDLFIVFARRALQEVDAGVQALSENASRLQGELCVGTTHTFNLRFIPGCVASICAQHPAVRVTVTELTAESVCRQLIDGAIDMGLSYRPGDMSGLEFEPLYDEQMVLVVAPSHKFARRKRLRLAELHRQPLVLMPKEFETRQMLDRCFSACGAVPSVVAQMSTIAPMLGLVQKSHIGAIVSENALDSSAGLVRIPLESPTPVRTPGILWRAGGTRSAPMRSFAAIARREAANRRHGTS